MGLLLLCLLMNFADGPLVYKYLSMLFLLRLHRGTRIQAQLNGGGSNMLTENRTLGEPLSETLHDL